MIKEEYFDSEAQTKVYCSVKDCNNLVFEVDDDRDGLNHMRVIDGEANVFCGDCSTKTLREIRMMDEQ